jgi:hypothetical protein
MEVQIKKISGDKRRLKISIKRMRRPFGYKQPAQTVEAQHPKLRKNFAIARDHGYSRTNSTATPRNIPPGPALQKYSDFG